VRIPFRPTVRARLALLLGALVVLTAVVLLAASWLLVFIRFRTTVYGLGTPGAQISGVSVQRPTVPGLLVPYGILLAVLVAIACGLAWLLSGRMLRPLRQITDTARRIIGDALHERLALGGPADELTELGGTFDAMLARLEAAFTDQQLFAANAAHELRTPLAVMRAELDLLLTGPEPSPAEFRDTAIRLRRTVLSSEQMLERLLTLTRGMLAPGEREPVPLDQIAGQALATAADTAGARGLNIRRELHAACAHGDPSLLGELAGNLIGNAVKHNRPDGWIAVGTRTAGDRVILEVSNSGQRIADADLDRLLEPFRRAGQQRTGHGSGLGLSIVRTIVAAHGGELRLLALVGGGLTVRVYLPAAPAGGDGQVPVGTAR
jgi:signal transduction histidine kinase